MDRRVAFPSSFQTNTGCAPKPPDATCTGRGGAAWELVGRLDAEVCFHRLKRFLVFKVSSGGFKKSELSAPILTRSERDRMTDALRPLACVESSPEYHRGGRSG